MKLNLLFFLGKKDKTGKEKVLCLEAAKAFFGSAIQLPIQIWILQGTSYNGESWRFSQYLSIIMSSFQLSRISIDLLSYSRPKNVNRGKVFSRQKMWNDITSYLSWVPLIITSLLFKIGTINLLIHFFGWYSLIIIIGIYCLNLLSSFMFSFIRKRKIRLSLVHKIKEIPKGEEKSHLHKLFSSYSNIFVISRPVSTIR